MNQLHQIHKDLNYLIKDQDDMIHEIMDNAEYADNNILKGTENLRDAKKLRTLGLF
jgi:t-SNARE complex subunit (syntaxin)